MPAIFTKEKKEKNAFVNVCFERTAEEAKKEAHRVARDEWGNDG